MVTQVAINAINVVMAAAPSSYFKPSASGAAVPPGGARWTMTVVSSLYTAGSTADLAIEYQYSGTWLQDSIVQGFTLGAYDLGGGITGVTNTVNPTITLTGKAPMTVGQTVIISGVTGATGVNGTFTITSIVSRNQFTITAAKPGNYSGGGSVKTATNTFSSSIGANAVPYPTNVRIRIDSIAAGTLDSVSVALN